jgi:hypothetical protein
VSVASPRSPGHGELRERVECGVQGAGRKPFRASLLDFTKVDAGRWFQDRMQEALDIGKAAA